METDTTTGVSPPGTSTNAPDMQRQLPLDWDGIAAAKAMLARGYTGDEVTPLALVAIAEELRLIRIALVAGNTARP